MSTDKRLYLEMGVTQVCARFSNVIYCLNLAPYDDTFYMELKRYWTDQIMNHEFGITL